MSESTLQTTQAGAPSKMTHRQIILVFSGLMLGMLLAALDQTIVSTALWTIVKDIGGTQGLAHMSWVVTAYLLASTASTPLYGKLSDLYGRKPVYTVSIVVFLAGSVLSGLAQNMGQLIAFRAIQGLGGGGLMVLAFAIISDVVSPRERGRYQGYFGGVFALASVAGPLLGGFFTEHATILGQTGWRWIFYVNLPVGILALAVTSVVLKPPAHRRQEHRIDWLGAALMVAGVSALLLVTVWGGQEYAWTSATILGLAAAGIALLVTFVVVELRAAEPILPMRLFGNPVFTVANTIAFIVGFAMFGSLIYISLYLQLVNGASPTEAGLGLLPMMVGVLSASILSGRLISKLGRYKVFPILGTAVATVGMGLLGTLTTTTPGWRMGLYMLILGAGLGMVMQVLVLAVQNAVPRSQLGVATSASTFFRSMGGSFGTAVFGAILAGRLVANLPAGAAGAGGTPNPAMLARLPEPVQHAVIGAFVEATNTVFLIAAVVMAAAFVLTWFLQELRLREDTGPHLEEAGAAPIDRDEIIAA